MDIYSKLNGSAPIAPVSGGIWKIQKKRKTNDQQQRKKNGRKMIDEEKDLKETQSERGEIKKRDTDGFDTNGTIGYGSAKKKRKAPRKIDLKI